MTEEEVASTASPEEPEPTSNRPRPTWRNALLTTAALVSLALTLLRDMFKAIERPVHPGAMTAVGLAIALAAAVTKGIEIHRKDPANWAARRAHWLLPAAVICLFAVLWFTPAPISVEPVHRMSGNTNIGVTDFVLVDDEAGTRGQVSTELALLVESAVIGDSPEPGVDVWRYDNGGSAPLDDPLERDDWAHDLAADTNAHVLIGGLVEPVSGVGTEIRMMVYVRRDVIPDAPELAGWIEAPEPILTLFDVTGASYDPSQRAELANDLGRAVSEIRLFALGMNDLRSGRPREAMESFAQLNASGTLVLPPEQIALFSAVAEMIAAQALGTEATSSALMRARDHLEPIIALLPRAAFVLAEVEFQEATLRGCVADRVNRGELQAAHTAYEGLTSSVDDPLLRAKARLGVLKVRSCAVSSGLVSDDARPSDVTAIRQASIDVLAEIEDLPSTDALAADPIAARLAAIWPELAMRYPEGQNLSEAATLIERAIDLERRPERAGFYYWELAVLEALQCDRAATERAWDYGSLLLDEAVELERLDEATVATLTEALEGDIRSATSDNCAPSGDPAS